MHNKPFFYILLGIVRSTLWHRCHRFHHWQISDKTKSPYQTCCMPTDRQNERLSEKIDMINAYLTLKRIDLSCVITKHETRVRSIDLCPYEDCKRGLRSYRHRRRGQGPTVITWVVDVNDHPAEGRRGGIRSHKIVGFPQNSACTHIMSTQHSFVQFLTFRKYIIQCVKRISGKKIGRASCRERV